MDTKPADDPGIAMQQAITHLFQSAKPIKDIEDIVLPHLSEMSSKIHLVRSTNAYHQIERGALYNLVRWTLEKLLWEDLINNKLTPAEKLCLLQLAIKEADKIQDFLGGYQHDLEKGGKGSSADVEAAREKSDRALTKIEDPTSKDLDGTSAVGRELARRVLERAGKAAEALVTETLKKPA